MAHLLNFATVESLCDPHGALFGYISCLLHADTHAVEHVTRCNFNLARMVEVFRERIDYQIDRRQDSSKTESSFNRTKCSASLARSALDSVHAFGGFRHAALDYRSRRSSVFYSCPEGPESRRRACGLLSRCGARLPEVPNVDFCFLKSLSTNGVSSHCPERHDCATNRANSNSDGAGNCQETSKQDDYRLELGRQTAHDARESLEHVAEHLHERHSAFCKGITESLCVVAQDLHLTREALRLLLGLSSSIACVAESVRDAMERVV